MQVEVDDNESVTNDSKGDKSNYTETVHSISEDGKSKVLHNIEEEITGMMNI